MISPISPATRLRPLFLIAAASASLLGSSVPALASYMHSDVSIVTYTDFAQNCGRYQSGNLSALLAHLNSGGVEIHYEGGQESYTVSYMPDFSSQTDEGFAAGIGVNFIATVQHVGTDPTTTFSARNVGTGNAIIYTGIEYADNGYRVSGNGMSYTSQMDSDFQWIPQSASGHADYKITRLNKIVTDVTLSTVYTGWVSSGTPLYRSASGQHYVVDHNGAVTSLCDNKYQYNVGGIVTAGSVTDNVSGTDASKITYRVNYSENGIGWSWSDYSKADLPSNCAGGDSGSPVWIQNVVDNEVVYQYLGASAEYYSNGTLTNIYSAGEWTQETMAQFDKTISAGTQALYIGAVKNAGEDISGSAYGRYGAFTTGTRLDYGIVSGGTNGNVQFIGMPQGTETWNRLNNLRDKDNWHAYPSLDDTTTLNKDNYFAIEQATTTTTANDPYLNLYYSENLIFEAGSAKTTIYVNETDVDLGIGYVRFSAGTQANASFELKSAGGFQLHSAGYIVDKNTSLHVYLKNSSKDLYTREWRKIGDGDLYLHGDDDDSYGNDVLLNLGGSGKTYLEYELSGAGYAVYNVLANTGAAVVIKDTKQIYRDFTFGNGGGTLDMNGNSMVWNNSNTAAAEGFTIHALTEEGIIYNGKGHTELKFTQSGHQSFLGAFRDSSAGSLKFIYNGGTGSSLTLNGVFTQLKNNTASGISVESGTLIFQGSKTVHALGSEDGTNADRLVRDNDWHYADTAANVEVRSGATLQLGSHARLSGDITVRDGGKFVMSESVQSRYEYIEGGHSTEDTYQIREFYGLKGNVVLEGKNSAMEVNYAAGTTAEQVYSGKISGNGSLLLNLGEASLRLSGENTHNGGTTLVAGKLIAAHADALGAGAVVVQSGAELALEQNVVLSTAAQALTLVVGAENSGATGKALITASEGGKIVIERDAQLFIDVSALFMKRSAIDLSSLKLASESALEFNTESARIGWYDNASGEWQDLAGYDFVVESGDIFLVIPEPSAFGLFAGLAALALCANRRRKQ